MIKCDCSIYNNPEREKSKRERGKKKKKKSEKVKKKIKLTDETGLYFHLVCYFQLKRKQGRIAAESCPWWERPWRDLLYGAEVFRLSLMKNRLDEGENLFRFCWKAVLDRL